MAHDSQRGPKAFRPDDPKLTREDTEPFEPPPVLEEATAPARVPNLPDMRRRLRWGALLLSSLTALAGLALSLWLADTVAAMLARRDAIGWLVVALLALAAFAALMLILREAWALARLARLGRTRADAETALTQGDKARARGALDRLKRLQSGRPELAWGRARLAEHEGDIMDARELLTLAERELVAPLDARAHAIVAGSARRVSVLTAVSPLALIDMVFVAVENLRMLRRLATLYGARPGMLGLVKLARMVVTHIVLTGGVALGDDVIHQMIGHGLTARLSARLGEGLFNGALTTRIGIAAIDVCRPLPYLEARRPRFRDLVAKVADLKASEGQAAGRD